MVRAATHANRGRAWEDLIEWANEQYRRRGIAVVHRIPAEWRPLRDRSTGRIAGAKVERKSIVDFLGRWAGPDGVVRPIAFDAKETQQRRWPFSALEEHQARFLDEWIADGVSVGFLLIRIGRRPDDTFAVPWEAIRERWWAWRGSGFRPSSVGPEDLEAWRVPVGGARAVVDYLAALERHLLAKVG